MTALLKAFLLPPTSLLAMALAGLWLHKTGRRSGIWVVAVAIGLLYLISTPILASLALGSLEAPYVDPAAAEGVQAIVVLGGGTLGPAPEYGADTVKDLTLARVRYAARLQRLTGKPLLTAGGTEGRAIPEARQMREILTREMHVPVRWIEDKSVNTYTNALESRRILAPLGITRIYLVTHAWHVPRAKLAFEHAGFSVVPAATGYTRLDFADLSLGDFLPRASSLLNSYYFCHEVLGYAAYAARIKLSPKPSGEGNEGSRQMR